MMRFRHHRDWQGMKEFTKSMSLRPATRQSLMPNVEDVNWPFGGCCSPARNKKS